MANKKTKILLIFFFLILVLPLAVKEIKKNRNANADSIIYKSQIEDGSYHPKEIVVKFKPKTPWDKVEALSAGSQTAIKDSIKTGFVQVELFDKNKNVDDVLADFKRDPDVEYAEPNYFVSSQMVPNDPYYGPYQWNFKELNMEKAWDKANGSSVTVAIIDTGVAYENYGSYAQAPDLAETKFVDGYDFVNSDSQPNDDNGHGTHLAGIIAQSTNNNLGTAGIAYSVSIMPVKVLDNRGNGNYYDVAKGVIWAVDHGAQIINLSVGGTSPAQYLEDALVYAHDRGVLVVSASGNGGKESLFYPAAYNKYVLSVGAVRFDGARPAYSNYGDNLDLAAPGGDTDIDQNGDGQPDGILQQTFDPSSPKEFNYFFVQGTSMAAAHATGVAALLYSRGETDPDEIKNVLERTAKDEGSPGWDREYGYGLIDANAALGYLERL
jgi:serine protease